MMIVGRGAVLFGALVTLPNFEVWPPGQVAVSASLDGLLGDQEREVLCTRCQRAFSTSAPERPHSANQLRTRRARQNFASAMVTFSGLSSWHCRKCSLVESRLDRLFAPVALSEGLLVDAAQAPMHLVTNLPVRRRCPELEGMQKIQLSLLLCSAELLPSTSSAPIPDVSERKIGLAGGWPRLKTATDSRASMRQSGPSGTRRSWREEPTAWVASWRCDPPEAESP